MHNKIAAVAICMAAFGMSATAQVTGSGTSGTVPVFTSTTAVGNSPISVSGSNVGIGTTSPSSGLLDIAAPDKTAESAIAIRQSNSPTFGFDISLDQQVNGMTYFYGVANNTKTALEQFDRINNYVIFNGGNVGIGTTNPLKKLHIAGDVEIDGQLFFGSNAQGQSGPYAGCTGADYAESVDVTGDRTKYEPGDVLVIDPKAPGNFLKSNEAYSTMAAGIYSTKPGYVGRLREANDPASANEIPMAMLGRVPTKVTAENGPIQVGDLLVTSSSVGYAMKGTDRSRLTGAVIGKALGSLDSGIGTIMVLVTLQ